MLTPKSSRSEREAIRLSSDWMAGGTSSNKSRHNLHGTEERRGKMKVGDMRVSLTGTLNHYHHHMSIKGFFFRTNSALAVKHTTLLKYKYHTYR